MFKVSSLGDCDVIIMAGAPASGKSRLCKIIQRHENYSVLNEYITAFNSQVAFEALIRCGNRVIVDRCNPTIDSRARYLKLARRYTKSIGLLYIEQSRNTTIDAITRDLVKSGIVTPVDAQSKAKDIANDFYACLQSPIIEEYDQFDVFLHLDANDIEEYFNSFDDLMYGPRQYVKK